jgi:hypothetical protein
LKQNSVKYHNNHSSPFHHTNNNQDNQESHNNQDNQDNHNNQENHSNHNKPNLKLATGCSMMVNGELAHGFQMMGQNAKLRWTMVK